MADEIGIKLTLDGKQVKRESASLSREISSDFAKTDRTIDKTSSSLARMSKSIFSLKGALVGLGVGLAVRQLADFTGGLLKAASDAEEVSNKFNVVFDGIKERADASAKALEKGFGLSSKSSEELLANTADLLIGFGFTRESALELSSATQQLAGDLASFNNLETADASERITKALTGEVESLKALNVVIRQDTKEYKDLVSSIQATEGATLLQAKALANLRIVAEQSINSIGDFDRSILSVANQTKILTGSWENLRVELGDTLLPVASKVIKETLIPAVKDLSDLIVQNKDNITEFATKGVESITAFKEPVKDLIKLLGLSASGLVKIADAYTALKSISDQSDIRKEYEKTNKAIIDQANLVIFYSKQLKKAQETETSANKINDFGYGVKSTSLVEDYAKALEKAKIKLKELREEKTKDDDVKAVTDTLAKSGSTVKEDSKTSIVKDYNILKTQELTKVQNEYIESLNREYDQFQLIKDISEQSILARLSGKDLEIAKLQFETSELKTQAALKIENEQVLAATLTEITNIEEAKKFEIKKRYSEKDAQLLKMKEAQEREAYASIAKNAIGALSNIFGENKLFASSTAAIDGILAVQKTMASVPYPLNIPLAISQGVLAASNVAKINGIGYADGTEYVSGSGSGRDDKISARLSDGEGVIDANNNARRNGISNDELIDRAVNGRSDTMSLGLINSLFTQEEIAQRLVDYGQFASNRGMVAQG